VKPSRGRGQEPAALQHLANDVGASGDAVEQVIALAVGDEARLVGLALTVAVEVEVNCPPRKAGLSGGPRPVAVGDARDLATYFAGAVAEVTARHRLAAGGDAY